SVQGTFKSKLRYPPSSKTATPTTLFSTEIPAFWNDSQLSALLAEKQVEINAKSTTASQSLLVELLLGFGPTLLIVGLFVLLARAVAGEAHAAFFSISAAEFIEAIVGVGASRVRDLFAKAKEAAPAIVFIDELDAIGRSRQGSVSVTGANDEREQTLDQILT